MARSYHLGWALGHAAGVHLCVLAAMGAASSRPAAARPPDPTVDVIAEPALPPPVPFVASPAPQDGPPRRPRDPPHRGSPPAAAASAIALPDVGEPLPVASAAVYPGGLTSSDGTALGYVGDLGGGGFGDLSAPARLGGEKHWSCTVDGPLAPTAVHLRALVRPDGSAERVESVDGDLTGSVLRGALPCALREKFLAGRDRSGRPATRWSLPFRVTVIGAI